ncbi:MAG: hypothetical protein HKN43_13020 [Rhodothermales bacterium]|nr:hypothetical protein [Rhodothermales bacterium]
MDQIHGEAYDIMLSQGLEYYWKSATKPPGIMKASYSSPAAETLLAVLRPLINETVIVETDIHIPGVESGGALLDRHVDVLLVGEYETVAFTADASFGDGSDWNPRYPMGLLTEVYTVPAVTLFFHLDDLAYLLVTANPSLFISGASQILKNRASQTVRKIAHGWTSGSLSIAYAMRHQVDLDIARETSIHRLDSGKPVTGRAA